MQPSQTIDFTCLNETGETSIRLVFVVEGLGTMSEKMKQVYEKVLERYPNSDNVKVITGSDCVQLKEENLLLTKDIMVFDKFSGDAFAHIHNMKTIKILGVKCLFQMYFEEMTLPAEIDYIFDLTLKDVIFCAASIVKSQKDKLATLIGYMGGRLRKNLLQDTDYMLTEDVLSRKYSFGCEKNIPALLPKSIEDLWKLVNASDDQLDAKKYLEKYKVPLFYKLIMCSTGLESNEKQNLIKLINDNGGDYSQTFRTISVKVLLMREKDLGTPKNKAAIQHKILCVHPDWIVDSVNAGYAINIVEDRKYRVESILKASTPERETSALGRFNFDNTMVSAICDSTSRNISIDETCKSVSRASSAKELVKESTFKKPMLPQKKTVQIDVVPEQPRNSSIIEVPPLSSEDSSNESSDISVIQILMNKTVCFYGYSNSIDCAAIIKECSKLGAVLVDFNFDKTIDYVITASGVLDIDPPDVKCTHLVNDVWLEDSVEQGRCVEVKFNHYPLFKPTDEHKVIKDEVFVCTNYETVKERPFIKNLVEAMGGDYKEPLMRQDDLILICQTAEGRKFQGAKSWGKTILRAEWLVECFKNKERVDETKFLVGGTKPSAKNIIKSRRDSIIPSSQEFFAGTKENFDSPVAPSKRVEQLRSASTQKTPRENENDSDPEEMTIDQLCEDLNTPQRQSVKSVLLEQQEKNKMSPRAKRMKALLKTPGNVKAFEESSPATTPDCIKMPNRNYGFRSEASPASSQFYKLKIDACDKVYESPDPPKLPKLKDESPGTPSYALRNFLKTRSADGINASMAAEASKFLPTESAVVGDESQNTDIIKLRDLLVVEPEPVPESKSAPLEQGSLKKSVSAMKLQDHDPHENFREVRWSYTQINRENLERKELCMSDDDEECDDDMNEMIFAITSTNEDKKEIVDRIKELNGKRSETDFTHLILPRMSKSSKYFSALAKGAVVLHVQYIYDSFERKRFLNTDPYEYGNPEFKINDVTTKDRALVEGPYNCRMLIRNNPEKYKDGLFTNMTFILKIVDDKFESFKQVIESGGGTILENPGFHISILKRAKVDYCLYDTSKALTESEKKVLIACNIKVKPVKYIYELCLGENF